MAVQQGNRMRKNVSGFNAYQKPTVQAKMIDINNKFGNNGIKRQQGSTIIRYDYLPLAEGLNPEQTFKFFLNANTRQFPFTNLIKGQLTVGESLAIERMYFVIMQVLDATGEITDQTTLETFGLPAAYSGEFQAQIENNVVVKATPMTSIKAPFNRYAYFADYNVFHFDTDVIIPPLLQFEIDLRTPIMTVPTSATLSFFIGCVLEGAGSILAPRSTF